MNNTLDMALDEIIKMNKQQQRRRGRGGGPRSAAGRAAAAAATTAAASASSLSLAGGGGRGRGWRRPGRGRGRGGYLGVSSGRLAAGGSGAPLRVRRPFNRANRPPFAKAFFSRNSEASWRHEAFEDVMGDAVRSLGIETGTKLYLSNLDYGVSNEDIKELFSEVGDLKRCGIHYDKSGRSKGTAEVVYSRRQDAVAALKRYNHVQLDGKPMKIELIGTNLLPPITRSLTGTPLRRGRRTVVVSGVRGRGSGYRRRGRGQGRGRGRRVPPSGREKKPPTVEELDAELEKYHQDAMQTS